MKNKKTYIIIVALLMTALIGVPTAEAITYSKSSDYWTTWRNNITNRTNSKTRYRSSRRRSVNWGIGYYRSKNKSVRSVPTSIVPYREKSTYPTTYQRSRSRTTTSSAVKSKYVLGVSVVSTEQSQPITTITQTPIRVFQLGVNNKSTVRKNSFVEALKLDTMTFQMFSNTGLAADPRMFELGVSETSGDLEPTYFQFDRYGKVTLKFNNARVAKGEGIELGIDVRVENAANTPRIPGAFKLRLLRATASTEQGGIKVTPQIVKNSLSGKIAFTPGAQVSVGETPGVETGPSSSTTIEGRIVSANERIFALALNFEAHYDDMSIEEIVVRNEIGGDDIDNYVDTVYAVDTISGQTLGQAKFTQGTATFRFFSPIRVNRERERHIGFKVQIDDRVDTGRYDTRFRLGVAPSDVVVRGIGSGRTLSDSYKSFSTNTHTFFAVQSGGGVKIESSAVQPNGFSATESMERIYQFKISNPDDKEISIGRLSFDVRLSGVAFSGGISTDDFQLKQMQRGREVEGGEFSPTGVSGNIVTFDTGTELYIPRHGEMEFALKTKLVDIAGGNSETDSVAVQILGDSTLTTGKLATVRSNNARFIWSDHSGRPHASYSTDWLSGYKISGLPSSTTRNYR
jgi:hypothetical protein